MTLQEVANQLAFLWPLMLGIRRAVVLLTGPSSFTNGIDCMTTPDLVPSFRSNIGELLGKDTALAGAASNDFQSICPIKRLHRRCLDDGVNLVIRELNMTFKSMHGCTVYLMPDGVPAWWLCK